MVSSSCDNYPSPASPNERKFKLSEKHFVLTNLVYRLASGFTLNILFGNIIICIH